MAAMLYCGFRSAAGAIRAMAGIEGPDLAKDNYIPLFSMRKKGIPHHERPAGALQDGVQELRRRKKIFLKRWVRCVHYSA